MAKVGIDVAGMKALLKQAKLVGTEDKWMELAVEWMEKAEEEIVRLQKEAKET